MDIRASEISDILKKQITGFSAEAELSETGQVVSVGDGPWDVRAAAELSLEFVGVGRDGAAEQLRALGARCVLPDFLDHAGVMRSLAGN